MTINGFLQIILYLLLLILLAKPLGSYMARVYEGKRTLLDPVLQPVERLLYRLLGVRLTMAPGSNPVAAAEEMRWQTYAVAMLLFSVVSFVFLYALQRIQALLPLNPEGLGAVSADSSFNTAVSFVSNTNWQGYGFGIPNSALWATVTTAASNGSVNAMHDSFMPLGGLVTLLMMQLGEVVFGGVGSGLYGMLAFVIVAVFVSGLMVGRTPEYLGKKIEAYEMKMASLVILIMPLIVLGFTALALVLDAGKATIYNPGAHGFSEVLYAFTSQGNNNGSAFAGLGANNPFYNTMGGLAMLISRFWLAIPILAIAGSLARKKKVPTGAGTLPTHTPLFVGWLIAIVLLVGALNFLPALALGPIVEQLML